MNLRVSTRVAVWPLFWRILTVVAGCLAAAAALALVAGLRLGWIDILPSSSSSLTTPADQPTTNPTVVELTSEKAAAAVIQTTAVRRASLQPRRPVPGEINYDAAKRVPVGAPVACVVLEVFANPAQEVAKGQPLATLASPDIGLARDQVLRREAELQLARRESERAAEISKNVDELLAMLQQKPKLSELEAALAQRVLGDYREKVVAAYSKLLLAERVLGASDALETGTLSTRLMEERRSSREQAAALFTSACETARFSAIQERDKARAAAEQAERLLAVSHQSLSNLLGPWADMTPISDRDRLSELTLISPLAGKVEERQAVQGARAVAGGPLFTIADTTVMWVSAEIHERDWQALDFVRPGESLPIRISALGAEPLTGKVLFVGGQIAAETRSVPLVAELANREGRLKAGMFAWVLVPLEALHEGLVVPSSSIMRHENQPFVFVPDGERKYRRVDVQLGLETDKEIEIVSGLSEGQEVVEQGTFFLKSELLLEREE